MIENYIYIRAMDGYSWRNGQKYKDGKKILSLNFPSLNIKVHFFINHSHYIKQLHLHIYGWKICLLFLIKQMQIALHTTVDRASFHCEVVFVAMTSQHEKNGKFSNWQITFFIQKVVGYYRFFLSQRNTVNEWQQGHHCSTVQPMKNKA